MMAKQKSVWGELEKTSLTVLFFLPPAGDWLHPLQCQHTLHDTCDWTAPK